MHLKLSGPRERSILEPGKARCSLLVLCCCDVIVTFSCQLMGQVQGDYLRRVQADLMIKRLREIIKWLHRAAHISSARYRKIHTLIALPQWRFEELLQVQLQALSCCCWAIAPPSASYPTYQCFSHLGSTSPCICSCSCNLLYATVMDHRVRVARAHAAPALSGSSSSDDDLGIDPPALSNRQKASHAAPASGPRHLPHSG